MANDSDQNYRKLYEAEHARRVELEQKLDKEQASFLKLNESLVELTLNLESRVSDRTAELEEARNEAIENVKIKSDFMANMSHEIRTPLNGVIGMLSAMANTQDERQRNKLIDIALEASHQLLAVLNDLLEFSKIESMGVTIEAQKTNLRKLVNYAAHQFAFLAQKKELRIRTDIDLNLPDYVFADGFRIQQVITNLLSNAIKFTQHGSITVKVRCTSDTDVKISVIDTGMGLNEEKKSKIFKAFNQGDSSITRQYGGTGLGLTICSQIVKAMDSKIEIESQLGKGSTFSFNLYLPWRSEDTLVGRYRGLLSDKTLYILSRDPDIEQLIEQLQKFGFCQIIWQTCLDTALPKSICKDTLYCLVDADDFSIDCPQVKALTSRFLPKNQIILSRYHSSQEVNSGLENHLFKPLRVTELLNLVSDKPTEQSKSSCEKTDLKNKTILVVDDNEINRVVVRELLAGTNCKVEMAKNGIEAIECVINDHYDIIFMDIQMPEMDGITATREIRKLGKAFSDIPIIAMTAHATPADVQRCMQAQMNEHLVKPVELQALWQVLGKYLGVSTMSDPEEISPETELPTINGFNLEYALSRLQNNVSTLQSLLGLYCKQNRTIFTDLTRLLENKQWESACSLAHSLKGTSANLGGKIISSIAARIEKRLRNNDKGSYDIELKELKLATSVIPTIEEWLEQSPESRTIELNTNSQLDRSTFIERLKNFDRELDVDIGGAQELFDDLAKDISDEKQKILLTQISNDLLEFNIDSIKKSIAQYIGH